MHVKCQNVILPCIVDLSAFEMPMEFLVGDPEHGVCTFKMVLI